MIRHNSCSGIRQKKNCFRQCVDWSHDTYNTIDGRLKTDLNELKNGEKLVKLNMNLIILISLFLLLCFMIYILFTLKKN